VRAWCLRHRRAWPWPPRRCRPAAVRPRRASAPSMHPSAAWSPPPAPPPGHSLGGGVAALVTLLLLQPGGSPPGIGDVRCVALGPAATLSESLTDACEGFITSVVHGTDPIPRLSCYSVECLLLDMVSASLSRRVAGLAGSTASAAGDAITSFGSALARLARQGVGLPAGGGAPSISPAIGGAGPGAGLLAGSSMCVCLRCTQPGLWFMVCTGPCWPASVP
jgi:hypothetical protein